MQAMKATIRNRSKLKAKSATDIEQQQMFKMKYPTWTKILTSFGDEEINCALAEFLVSIIEHTEGLFKLAPERQPEDYDETVDGEIDSQLFPNFPILRQRAFYEKECQAEDGKSFLAMHLKAFLKLELRRIEENFDYQSLVHQGIGLGHTKTVGIVALTLWWRMFMGQVQIGPPHNDTFP